MFGMLRSLWHYRSFIISSVRNEFATRFARSRLGGLWMIIHPLVQVAIYALILSNVLSAKLPGIENKYSYAIYLIAGTLAWSLFSEIISRCLNLFIEHGNLMKKMRFPRIALPAIVVGSSVMNYLVLLLAAIVVFLTLRHELTLYALWIIPLTFVVLMLSLGIGLILGVLNVFIRDIGQVTPILLQLVYWFTPIVYPENIIPAWAQQALSFNPLYPIVRGYHDALVYGSAPDIAQLTYIALCSFMLLLLGLFMFRRASAEMVDAL
ncbi:lipopolysaccharide transport system permease protein [Pseudomonas nitritireducens]|uniref:Transport permease protein n=1 Tax=Pseudomonas nitroreducens TaxID=46680 RepID=A0A7W7NZZ5_PSENT|nr:ABC transporter permease [Pseudomonas nitritireducens]MBB4863001.1 lipopolysaccharide transport system permease protein [Pseudomonas nitritireducens]